MEPFLSSPVASPIEMAESRSFNLLHSPPDQRSRNRKFEHGEEDSSERTTAAIRRRQDSSSPLQEPATELRGVSCLNEDEEEGDPFALSPMCIPRTGGEPRMAKPVKSSSPTKPPRLTTLQLELEQASHEEDAPFGSQPLSQQTGSCTVSPGMPHATTAVFTSGDLNEASPAVAQQTFQSLMQLESLPYSTGTALDDEDDGESRHTQPYPRSSYSHGMGPPSMVTPDANDDLFTLSASATPHRMTSRLARHDEKRMRRDGVSTNSFVDPVEFVGATDVVDEVPALHQHRRADGSDATTPGAAPFSALWAARGGNARRMMPLVLDFNTQSARMESLLTVSPLTPASHPAHPPVSSLHGPMPRVDLSQSPMGARRLSMPPSSTTPMQYYKGSSPPVQAWHSTAPPSPSSFVVPSGHGSLSALTAPRTPRGEAEEEPRTPVCTASGLSPRHPLTAAFPSVQKSPQPGTPAKMRRPNSRVGTPQKMHGTLTPQRQHSGSTGTLLTPGRGATVVLDVNRNPFSQSRGVVGEMQAVTDFHLPSTEEAQHSLTAIRHRRTLSMETNVSVPTTLNDSVEGGVGFSGSASGMELEAGGGGGFASVVLQRPLAAHAAAVTYASSVAVSLNPSLTPSRCLTPVQRGMSPQRFGRVDTPSKLNVLFSEVQVTTAEPDSYLGMQEKSPDVLAKTMDPNVRRPSLPPPPASASSLRPVQQCPSLYPAPLLASSSCGGVGAGVVLRGHSIRTSPFAGRILGGGTTTPTATAVPTTTTATTGAAPPAQPTNATGTPHSAPSTSPTSSGALTPAKGWQDASHQLSSQSSQQQQQPSSSQRPGLSSGIVLFAERSPDGTDSTTGGGRFNQSGSASSSLDTTLCSQTRVMLRSPPTPPDSTALIGTAMKQESFGTVSPQKEYHRTAQELLTQSPARGLFSNEEDEDEEDFLYRTTGTINESLHFDEEDDGRGSSPRRVDSSMDLLSSDRPQRMLFAEDDGEGPMGVVVRPAGGLFGERTLSTSILSNTGRSSAMYSHLDGGARSYGDEVEVGDRFRLARFTFHHLNPVSQQAEFMPLHLDRNGTVWLGFCRLDGQPYAVKEIPFAFLHANAAEERRIASAELPCLTLGTQLATRWNVDAADHIVRYHEAYRDVESQAMIIQVEYFTKGNVAETYLCRAAPSSSSSSTSASLLWSEDQILVMIAHVVKALRATHQGLGVVHGNPIMWNVFAVTNYHYKLGNFGCAHVAASGDFSNVPVWCPQAHYPTRPATDGAADRRPLPEDHSSEYTRDYAIFAHSLLSLLAVLVEQKAQREGFVAGGSATSVAETAAAATTTTTTGLSPARPVRPRLGVPATPPLAPVASPPCGSSHGAPSIAMRQNDGEYLTPDFLFSSLHQRKAHHPYTPFLMSVVQRLFHVIEPRDVDGILQTLMTPSSRIFHLQNTFDREIVSVLQKLAHIKAKKEALMRKQKRSVSPRSSSSLRREESGVAEPMSKMRKVEYGNSNSQSNTTMSSPAVTNMPGRFSTPPNGSLEGTPVTSPQLVAASHSNLMSHPALPPLVMPSALSSSSSGHLAGTTTTALRTQGNSFRSTTSNNNSQHPSPTIAAHSVLPCPPRPHQPQHGAAASIALSPPATPQSLCSIPPPAAHHHHHHQNTFSMSHFTPHPFLDDPTPQHFHHPHSHHHQQQPSAPPPLALLPTATTTSTGSSPSLHHHHHVPISHQVPPPHPSSVGTPRQMLTHTSIGSGVASAGRWGGYSLPTTPRLFMGGGGGSQLVSANSTTTSGGPSLMMMQHGSSTADEAAKHRMERLVRTAAPGASSKSGSAAMLRRLFHPTATALTNSHGMSAASGGGGVGGGEALHSHDVHHPLPPAAQPNYNNGQHHLHASNWGAALLAGGDDEGCCSAWAAIPRRPYSSLELE